MGAAKEDKEKPSFPKISKDWSEDFDIPTNIADNLPNHPPASSDSDASSTSSNAQ